MKKRIIAAILVAIIISLAGCSSGDVVTPEITISATQTKEIALNTGTPEPTTTQDGIEATQSQGTEKTTPTPTKKPTVSSTTKPSTAATPKPSAVSTPKHF